MVHVLQDGHRRQELFELLSFLLGGVLDDVVKSVPVQNPELGVSLSNNGGSSWSIIEKCKLSKDVTSDIVLQECLLTSNDLGALEVS